MSKKPKADKRREVTPCWDALACPFCGWVPTIQPCYGGGPRRVMIACSVCHVAPSVIGGNKATALRRWNTRAKVVLSL